MFKDILTKGGKSDNENEDCVYLCDDFGFVMDGATGLLKENITNCVSDAKWYVEEFKNFLITNLKTKKNLKEIMKDGIRYVSNTYNNIEGATSVKSKPSSGIALFRKNENNIEYFILGDCQLIIKDKKNIITKLQLNDLPKLDNINIGRMVKIAKEKNINVIDARPLINDYLVETRLTQNTNNGYWILSDDINAVDHALHGTLNLKDIKQIIGLTDGFSQLYEVFKVFTYEELVNLINNKKISLDNLYDTLFTLQENDSNCNRYPRFKIRDDASIFNYELD